jgi:hypothetical protein
MGDWRGSILKQPDDGVHLVVRSIWREVKACRPKSLRRIGLINADLPNALDVIGKVGAGFRSLADTWSTPRRRMGG